MRKVITMWEKVLKYETEYDSEEAFNRAQPRNIMYSLLEKTDGPDDVEELIMMLVSELERNLPVEKIREMLRSIKADLNNSNQVRKLIKDAFNKMKGLDCLIKNASVKSVNINDIWGLSIILSKGFVNKNSTS